MFPRSLKSAIILLFISLLIFTAFDEAFPRTIAIGGQLPPRTWFLHGRAVPSGFNLTMNESGPELSGGGIAGSDHVWGAIAFGYRGQTSARFTLNPSYPSGLDILRAVASMEVWFSASQTQDPCCFTLDPLNARFNFTWRL